MPELKESPCKKCPNKNLLPGCIKNCKILHKVQVALAADLREGDTKINNDYHFFNPVGMCTGRIGQSDSLE